MSRRPMRRDRFGSIAREEVVSDESTDVLVDRFLNGIGDFFSQTVDYKNVKQTVITLNGLVRKTEKNNSTEPLQVNERIIRALHLGLFNPVPSVRAACARLLRILVTDADTLEMLLRLNTNIAISRCLDLTSLTGPDYFQAIRLISSLYSMSLNLANIDHYRVNDFFFVIISSCCASIAHDAGIDHGKISKALPSDMTVPRKLTVEIISEVCLCSPKLPTAPMLRSLMAMATSETFYLSINEAVVGVFSHLLNYPHSRKVVLSSGCLEHLIARFADDTLLDDEREGRDDAKPLEFAWKAAQFTLTKLFHSGPATFALLGGTYCRELLNGLSPPMGFEPGGDSSGYFVTEKISSKRIKRQRELLILISSILNIRTPLCTNDINKVIASTDPRRFEDMWSIQEGFVAAEADDLLQISFPLRSFLASPSPDPPSTLMALILSTLIDAHLVSALTSYSLSCFHYSRRGSKPSLKNTISKLDPHFEEVQSLGTMAAVILGHVVYQSKSLLCNGFKALDEIDSCVSAFHGDLVTTERQDVICSVIDILNQTENYLRNAHNEPSSLHLEIILRYCSHRKVTPKDVEKNESTRPRSFSNGNFIRQLLESSNLLSATPQGIESKVWVSIKMLLEHSVAELKRSLSDSEMLTAFRNLANFYRPSGAFCHTDVSALLRDGGRVSNSKNRLPEIVHCAVSMMELLLTSAGDQNLSDGPSPPTSLSVTGGSRLAELSKIAVDLISEIRNCLQQLAEGGLCHVGESKSATISVAALSRLGAQFWFVIIGLCTLNSSREMLLLSNPLQATSAFEIMEKFIETSSQSFDTFKLVLSFLNYSTSALSRRVLKTALHCDEEPVKLYASRLVVGLWIRIDKLFSFAEWACPIIGPLIGNENEKISESVVQSLLQVVPRCPLVGTVLRSLKSHIHFKRDKVSHRLLYGCCLVSPGTWQMPNAREVIAAELDFWIKENFHEKYSQFCDEIFVQFFFSSFTNGPGEHFSNAKSTRHLRLPGKHSPPSIFVSLARSQQGVQLLSEKAEDFLQNCIDVVQQYCHSSDIHFDSSICLKIRSSIVILANVCSNPLGAELLRNLFPHFQIVNSFLSLARGSPVFSVRGTAIIGLSVVGSHVDPEALQECKWVDRRRHSTLHQQLSSNLSLTVTDVDSVNDNDPNSRRSTFSGVGNDQKLEQLAPPVHHYSLQQLVKRRASTTDLSPPTVTFGICSISSSPEESSGSESSLDTTLGESPVSTVEVKRPNPPVRQKSSISLRLSGLFRRSKVNLSETSDTSDSAFLPHGEQRSAEKLRRKSESVDSHGGLSKSLSITGVDSSIALRYHRSSSVRSVCIDSVENVLLEENPQTLSLLEVFSIDEYENHSSEQRSHFYLPMEELSSITVSSGVFLPPNVAELLQDSTFERDYDSPYDLQIPVDRRMSVLISASSQPTKSGSGSEQANESFQLFPSGEASNLMKKHDSVRCLICSITNVDKSESPISDEWQQIAWLVVAMQHMPAKALRMLQNFVANKQHIMQDGCLYSEVVALMAKLAIPRVTRAYVHLIFTPILFPQLSTCAKELHTNVV